MQMLKRGARWKNFSRDSYTFCLEIVPLIERESIVMPTAIELSILFDWYLDRQDRSLQEPAIIISPVCPDYPFYLIENKAVFA